MASSNYLRIVTPNFEKKITETGKVSIFAHSLDSFEFNEAKRSNLKSLLEKR